MDDIIWITYNGRHIPLTDELKEKLKKKKEEQNNKENKSDKKDTSNKETNTKKEENKKEVEEKSSEKKENVKEKKEVKENNDLEDKSSSSDKTEKEINEYKPKHLYDVGYVPERESLDYANKNDLYTVNKTMADGNEIGDNDKEGLKDIGGPTVSYTMSDDRYYNLSKEERKAMNKIINNNKEAERLETENTNIINDKSSRKDWHKHLGESGKHTHEEKNGKGYYDELGKDDKLKIINNDKKIQELKQDSIEQAKILDNGPTHGKYSLDSDKDIKAKKAFMKNNITKDLKDKEKSSGVIVLDKGKVLLVEHSDGRFGFPKGHTKIGEKEEKGALREVLEETNYNVDIKKGFRQPTQYKAESGETKTEVYFVGTPKGNNKIISKKNELKGAKFYSIDEAKEKLKDYNNLVKILDRATKTSNYDKEINKLSSLRTLSDIEQYYLAQGYSKATALKYAKEEIRKRKNK